jgi:hypothetical protein
MLQLIWNSHDGRIEIYRHRQHCYSLCYNGHQVLGPASYALCCMIAKAEYITKNEMKFPDLTMESGFDPTDTP